MFGSSARAGVIRQAVLYTPLLIACIIVELAGLFGIWRLGPVLPFIVLGVGALFGYQSVQALRDLREQLQTTRGPVLRIWSKMDLFVTKSYYIAVGRHIFRIPLPAYFDLREEAKRLRAAELDDEYRIEVEVVHYPHTGIVESVARVGQIRIRSDEPARA